MRPIRSAAPQKRGADLVWPSLEADRLLPGTLSAGHPEANAANRTHLDAAIPMSFVAQIDPGALPDVPQLSDLSEQGRWLFFYDVGIGSYESAAQLCPVIWDQTDTDALADLTSPAALTLAADALGRDFG